MFPEQPTFPNESEAYRAARNELLAKEQELRALTEAVAAQRRKLPLGGEVPEDYVFEEWTNDGVPRPVPMGELFAKGKNSLFVYSFMYGPEMKNPCPMCASFIDGLNAQARHLEERINLAVVARSPIERLMHFAQERGWYELQLLSSEKNGYNAAYHAESSDGSQWPIANVFAKRDGRIHHTWASEMLFCEPLAQGLNPRHVDPFWPLWNVLDATPEGRGSDWFPSLS